MTTLTIQPGRKARQVALESLEEIQPISNKLRSKRRKAVEIKIEEAKEVITIPFDALQLLVEVLKHMADGKAISLIPSNSEVTTQQAAEMLNVSRPHLTKLLKQGKIPFKKVGSHRRILIDDIQEYIEEHEKIRAAQLDFLAQQAQELDLGYK